MRKTISLVCHQCKQPFEKDLYEYRRWVKQGRTVFYCGLSCHMLLENKVSARPRSTRHLNPGNRLDSMSPFRWYMHAVRARIPRKGATDLTLEYLANLWSAQQGRCPFTGWDLELPLNAHGWPAGVRPHSASLDRIDALLGYVQGNVRFVSVMANYARNTFSDEDLRLFCSAVYLNSRL